MDKMESFKKFAANKPFLKKKQHGKNYLKDMTFMEKMILFLKKKLIIKAILDKMHHLIHL